MRCTRWKPDGGGGGAHIGQVLLRRSARTTASANQPA